MKVKVECHSCGRKIKLTVDYMREAKKIKKSRCTCMNCLRIPKVDSSTDYANKVLLSW